jgi:restriction system protein
LRESGGAVVDSEESVEPEPRREAEEHAHELIKDILIALDWEQMQDLVAGILRAMDFKTKVSPRGADRGRDIVASPDGLGLRDPRIVAEVKHRKGAMGAPEVRNFAAGLRGSDRGMFVSTGGFTKEARYEADRAQVPVTLLDLDEVAKLLIEHYDRVDQRTTALVPLTPIYWPTGRSL